MRKVWSVYSAFILFHPPSGVYSYYLLSSFVFVLHIPSSAGGRAATREALERAVARRSRKRAGRSLTTMMPSEEGPKASVKVSKDTDPLALYTLEPGVCLDLEA